MCFYCSFARDHVIGATLNSRERLFFIDFPVQKFAEKKAAWRSNYFLCFLFGFLRWILVGIFFFFFFGNDEKCVPRRWDKVGQNIPTKKCIHCITDGVAQKMTLSSLFSEEFRNWNNVIFGRWSVSVSVSDSKTLFSFFSFRRSFLATISLLFSYRMNDRTKAKQNHWTIRFTFTNFLISISHSGIFFLPRTIHVHRLLSDISSFGSILICKRNFSLVRDKYCWRCCNYFILLLVWREWWTRIFMWLCTMQISQEIFCIFAPLWACENAFFFFSLSLVLFKRLNCLKMEYGTTRQSFNYHVENALWKENRTCRMRNDVVFTVCWLRTIEYL